MKTDLRVVLLFASLFLVMLGFGMIVPLMPFLARDLGATSVDMGLLVAAWAGAQFVMSPRWGVFSDRVGRRPAIMLGLVGFGVAFFLMGMADRLWVLYAARILGGMLSAATMPAAQAYMADITSLEERGPAMGLLGAAFGVGFMVGPAVGGLLAFLGVRFAFFAGAGLGWVTALLVYLLLPEPEHRSEVAGTRASAVSAVVEAMRKPYWVLFIIPFCLTLAGSALFSMMGFYLIDHFSAAESGVGVAFSIMGGTMALTQGLLLRPLLVRLRETRALKLGMMVTVAGFAGLILAPNVPLFMVLVGLTGLGMGVGRPVVASILSRATDMGQGVTMGLQTSFDALGRMVGPVWAGFLYAQHMQAPFLSAVVVLLLATLLLGQVQAVLDRSVAAAAEAAGSAG